MTRRTYIKPAGPAADNTGKRKAEKMQLKEAVELIKEIGTGDDRIAELESEIEELEDEISEKLQAIDRIKEEAEEEPDAETVQAETVIDTARDEINRLQNAISAGLLDNYHRLALQANINRKILNDVGGV